MTDTTTTAAELNANLCAAVDDWNAERLAEINDEIEEVWDSLDNVQELIRACRDGETLKLLCRREELLELRLQDLSDQALELKP